MAEYIDKAYALEILQQSGDAYGTFSVERSMYLIAKQKIKNITPADVVLVKHGKWVWNPNGMDWGLGAWECSECACRNNNLPINNKINPLVFSGSKYCPNCGADMRGNSDE